MTQLSFGKLPRWAIALLAVLLLLAGAGELVVTDLLIEHVPWLGWSLVVLSVGSVVFAIVHRMRPKRPAETDGPQA